MEHTYNINENYYIEKIEKLNTRIENLTETVENLEKQLFVTRELNKSLLKENDEHSKEIMNLKENIIQDDLDEIEMELFIISDKKVLKKIVK